MKKELRNIINKFLQNDELEDYIDVFDFKWFDDWKNHQLSWGEFFKKVVIHTLTIAPYIDRPENNQYVYHYSDYIKEIKTWGMRGSNFLNNRNDDHEIIFLLNAMGIRNDDLYRGIYLRASNYRYNSFAYQEIDRYALSKGYIKNRKVDNKLSIKISDYITCFSSSKVADDLYHGYIRYGLAGKNDMLEFLGKIANILPWKRMHWRYRYDFIELLTVACTFVKREKDGSNLYFKEKEYRFLYVGITRNSIPYLKIKLDPKKLKYSKI